MTAANRPRELLNSLHNGPLGVLYADEVNDMLSVGVDRNYLPEPFERLLTGERCLLTSHTDPYAMLVDHCLTHDFVPVVDLDTSGDTVTLRHDPDRAARLRDWTTWCAQTDGVFQSSEHVNFDTFDKLCPRSTSSTSTVADANDTTGDTASTHNTHDFGTMLRVAAAVGRDVLRARNFRHHLATLDGASTDFWSHQVRERRGFRDEAELITVVNHSDPSVVAAAVECGINHTIDVTTRQWLDLLGNLDTMRRDALIALGPTWHSSLDTLLCTLEAVVGSDTGDAEHQTRHNR